jgi:hypothetical protein
MQTGKTTFISGAALAVLATWAASLAAVGQQMKSAEQHQMAMPAVPAMTNAQKIANALTAAPAAISGKATILDWPAKEGDKPSVLRAGTNGWSCLPDMPETRGNDPMCLDEPWMKWVDAYIAKTAPAVGHVGIGYMIAPGGGMGSNTDPYAMTETADNHWGLHKPHVMIVVPDLGSLDGLSKDPDNGGPYVMYAGTPYAHIMAPVMPAGMSMSGK